MDEKPPTDAPSEDDRTDPRKWPHSVRTRAVVALGVFSFLEPLASSMVASALQLIANEFNITSSVERNLVLSAFVLPYAIGTVLFAPLSEIIGRRPIMLSCTFIFTIFTLGCGFAMNTAQLIVMRVFAGLGASAVIAIGASIIGDMYAPEERGSAMAIYMGMQISGPAVGPIMAAAIAQTIDSWRWTFWITSIATSLVLLFGYFFLPETYAPKLQRTHTISSKLLPALKRPFIYLFTQPIIQVLALYGTIIFGTYYIFLTTITTVFTSVYGQSVLISSLHYLAMLLGFMASTILSRKGMDYLYNRTTTKRNTKSPEARIPFLSLSATFLPSGLLIYGWSAQNAEFWFVPDIGLFLMGLGIPTSLSTIQHYVLDCCSQKGEAASALAGMNVVRFLAGFGFPLFADEMYDTLGYGWGNTLLALIAVVSGGLSVMLWYIGPRLRGMSSLADAG